MADSNQLFGSLEKESAVPVDAGISFLTNTTANDKIGANGDGAGIQFIDEDEDLTSELASKEEKPSSNFGSALKNAMLRNSCSPPPLIAASVLDERIYDSRTSGGASVTADIDDSNLRDTEDDLEFGECRNLRQKVPPPQCFGSGLFDQFQTSKNNAKTGTRSMQPTNPISDINIQNISAQLASLRNVEDSATRNEQGQFKTRTGKPLRRKQKADVRLSNQVEGYCGDLDVPTLLQYIEGADAPDSATNTKKPRDEQGKKQKKKFNVSGDQGVIAQKKEKSGSSGSVDEVSSDNRSTSLEKLATDAPAVNCNIPTATEDLNRFTPMDSGTALTEGLNPNGPALRTDLAPTLKSVTEKPKFPAGFINRRQPPVKFNPRLRIITSSKLKRSTTPPPAATTSRQWNEVTTAPDGRYRRYSFTSPYTALPLTKEQSVSSTCSTRSSHFNTGSGCSTDITNSLVSQNNDAVDSELGNVSFNSVDGENASSKVPCANIAAINRSEDDIEKPILNQVPADDSNKSIMLALDIKKNADFPTLPSPNPSAILSEEDQEAVSLPPVKSGDQPLVVAKLDSVCSTPNADRNIVYEMAAVESSQNTLVKSKSVLQMIFDSCENNGDSSGIIPNQTVITRSSTESDDGNSAPAVQFVGMAASQPNGTSGNLVFGDTADYFNMAMTKSTTSVDTSPGISILDKLLRPMKSDPDLSGGSSGTMENAADMERCTSTPNPPNVGYPEKVIREMVEFANQAWMDFNRGVSPVPFYVPHPND